MFTNRSGKPLLCTSWLAAVLIALPVWSVLYLHDSPALEPIWPAHAPVAFLLLALLYPVLEEMVFRGLIQGEFMRRTVFRQQFTGITLANVLTSALFATSHLMMHSVSMAALVFLPSLVFGYFRDRYDGWLLPAILLHIYYNLGYFLLFKPAI